MTDAQLDPIDLPLVGSSLIEASAGTGKTYTLALLYLRLILGHGKTPCGRPLTPPEILVLTFTNAATEELRARIRARLLEMAELMRADSPPTHADPLLLSLRDTFAPDERGPAAYRLGLAAEWLDEAAISTIHAWCYRMLREHALVDWSGKGPQWLDDPGPLIQQAAEDYWRTFVLGLAPEPLRLLLQRWSKPESLAKAVGRLLCEDELPMCDGPEPVLEQYLRSLAELKDEWRTKAYIASLTKLFEEAAKAKAFDQRLLNKNHRAGVLEGLAAWLDDPQQERPKILANTSWRRMSSLEVRSIWKDRSQAPVDHPACCALAGLEERIAALDPTPLLLAHAARWIAERLAQEKRRQGLIAQHDLLLELDRALRGPRGQALALAIRRQFPAVLVDEFQDTDPIQYRILDAIYDLKGDGTTALILVGDPKQAIYAFRGADVHVYLRARAATQRQKTLEVNYRSAPDLIEAVNAFFAQGNRRDRGPFLFGDDLPFRPARSGLSRAPRLWIDGSPCPPFQTWVIEPQSEGAMTKEAYLARSAELASALIADLIDKGGAGRAWIDLGEGRRPLRPADLVVLVNNRNEAAAIRESLRRRGIACAYLSEHKSVFTTDTAKELLIILRALAEPLDEGLMRQALATRLLGRSLTELDRLNRDELCWESEWERLQALARRWRQQGVLPMLYRLIGEFGVAERLLARADGERQLTDLLHLGELLQAASAEIDGEQALVRFLADAIREHAEMDASESSQLRLESDAHLVRVVTIHKSKGLEYPLVFLPFAACLAGGEVSKAGPWITHDAGHRRRLHLVADNQVKAEIKREQLAEALRKLYVALTRACVAVWMGLGPVKELSDSAPGYLLGLGEADAMGLCEALKQIPQIALIDAGSLESLALEAAETCRVRSAHPTLEPARRIERWRWEPWWIGSYSALRPAPAVIADEPRPGPAQLEDREPAETLSAEIAREEGVTVPEQTGVEWPAFPPDPYSLHAFPRGGRFGTFLHGLIEWAARRSGGFAEALADGQGRYQMLVQRCRHRRLDAWSEPLDAWLKDLLDRTWSLDDLKAPALRLADLDPSDYQVELEFWVEAHQLDLKAIDALISEQTLARRPRPPLTGERLNGMLKGFIDLAFVHRDRYYILDWKSNWLGPDDGAYTQEAMAEAICAHRYDLQYVLYLLALHRQLQARLPGYDYDRHLGGAIYVFLRGVQAPSQGLFVERPPRALIEALDRMLRG